MAIDNSIRSPGPQVAIIGGGIVGVILTLGLLRHNVSVRLYEQSGGFREIGAGIAFSACARRCMELMDPAIIVALKRCGAVPIADKSADEDDHLRWIDGYNQHRDDDPSYQKPLAELGGSGFYGCRRDQFLEELAKDVPPGVIMFHKRLEDLKHQKDGKIQLEFVDESVIQVDAVIGCDGIKSRVRQFLFGADHPASHPQYTHKVAYRGLIPMPHAIEVLGPWKANNFHHHVGPGAHLTHYPVANRTMLNVVVFLSDRNEWPDPAVMVNSGSRSEVESALRGWHPTVLGVVKLLPDELSKWALFDQGEFPLPLYNVGRVCVAGDAAHASSPHHGAGACLGIEDALCLSTLLGAAQSSTNTNPKLSPIALIETAFATFDSVRRPRTQWLVNSSRRVCDLYHQQEWAEPKRWVQAETCFEEIADRSHKIWGFDADEMVRETEREFGRRVG